MEFICGYNISMNTNDTTRMGRPPKPPDERKSSELRIRLTEADRETLDEAAGARGAETSTWARDVLLKAAKRRT